jgi:hypothetical protein
MVEWAMALLTLTLVAVTIVYVVITRAIAKASHLAAEVAQATLFEQQRITKAAIYSQLRTRWSMLDEMMLTHAGAFRDNNKPAAPLTRDGLPSDDPRVYIMYLFFGVVEEMLYLKKQELVDPDDLASFENAVANIMQMEVVRAFWEQLCEDYPPFVQKHMKNVTATD